MELDRVLAHRRRAAHGTSDSSVRMIESHGGCYRSTCRHHCASAEPAISLWRLAGGIYGTHFDLYARAALQISARGEP